MRKRALVLIASMAALFAAFAPTARAGSSMMSSSSGNFHLSCGFTHQAPEDPIVFPGVQNASHMHDFFGSTTTGFASTLASMTSSATTCDNLSDHSGYWAPSLVAPNGTIVQPLSTSVYYWARVTTVTAIPDDFRMIAGGDTRNLRASGYACAGGTPVSSVPLNCGADWLKAVIVFPSCWDGVNLDSADHRSHVAYPTGKGCPAGFPVSIPKVVFHVRYGLHDGTGYYASSDAKAGMTNGMSMHADVWSDWNTTVEAGLVQSCLVANVTC